jgi:hypothetical protein
MSSGTFNKTCIVSVTVKTGMAFDNIAVDVDGTWDHDPGCWRTRNGDGWPETLAWDFEISDPTKVLTQIADQAYESGTSICMMDSEIIEAVRSAVDKHLDSLSIEDIMENDHD